MPVLYRAVGVINEQLIGLLGTWGDILDKTNLGTMIKD